MSLGRRIAGWFVTPVDMQFTVAPADIVPGFPPAADVIDLALDDTPGSAGLESGARVREALRLVEAALSRESDRARKTGIRNPDLANLCLEVRSALRPSAPGKEVLREVPSVGIRYASVPVVPGRAA